MENEIKDLRQTYSNLKAVGTLKEKHFEVKDGKLSDGTPCKTLTGNFILNINGADYKFRTNFVNDKFNSGKDNWLYKELLEMDEQLLGTKFTLDIQMDRFNDYKSPKTGRVNSVDEYHITHVHIADVDDEEMFEGRVEGIILRIQDEIVNEETTGRKIITLGGIGYKSVLLPHKIYAEEDVAENFGDSCFLNVGDVTTFDVEVVTKTYGTVKQVNSGFAGGRSARVTSGFTREEIHVIGASEPIEEEQVNKKGEPLYISLEDVKPLIEARKIKLEAIEKGEAKKSESTKGLDKESAKSVVDESFVLPF